MPRKPEKVKKADKLVSGTNHHCYLGIDPGKQGGIVVIKDKQVVYWTVMPPSDLDLINTMKQVTKEFDIRGSCLERVNSMPGEGHKGAFSFGQGYGKLQIVLTCQGLGYENPSPRVWQKGLGIVSKNKKESKPQFKERLRQTCQRLFPTLELWSQKKTLGKQRAVCDSILIAEYCRRKNQGLLK